MGEYVWLAVVLLLALYGLTQGVGRLMLWMWRPRRPQPAVLILPVSGHCEDVEHTVRGALARQHWVTGGGAGRVLLLDAGMDEPTRDLARAVCARLPGVEFCRSAGDFQI